MVALSGLLPDEDDCVRRFGKQENKDELWKPRYRSLVLLNLERAMGIEQIRMNQTRRYHPLFGSIGVKWSQICHECEFRSPQRRFRLG